MDKHLRRGWSIRTKLILFLMAVTVLPSSFAIAITYFHTTRSLNEQVVTGNQEVIENGKQDITTYLEDFSYIQTTLYRYTPLMNVLRDGVSDDLVSNQEEINRILIYLFNTRAEIEQMHLYIHEGKDSYTNYHSALSGRGTYENVYEHPYYNKFSRSNPNNNTMIEPPHEIYSYNNLSMIPNSQKKNVLSFHNIIRDVPYSDPLAFLSVDINLSQIESIAERLYTQGAEDFYLMNEEGRIVYSSESELIGKPNRQEWYKRLKQAPEKAQSMEWKDDNFSGVIIYDEFSNSLNGWHIVKRIPYDLLYQGARETALMNILIGLGSLVIVVLATMVISFKFTEPIKVLIANMKKVEKGVFQADFDTLGNDEFGMLGRHFKMMIATINDLIQREYKLEIENKSAQLKVLQSQINPHFLYNALQSIGTLALKHKAVPVYSLLTSLSKIMRYSMNMKDDIVPLSDEALHVKSYLQLQKQRFGDRFEYEILIQPEAESIQVPKMILQPIVENSFKHGFDQTEGPALIKLEAGMQENGRVRVTIKDNGTGISEVDARKLQEDFGRSSKYSREGDSIGLRNIYDRLKIYYQNDAAMEIEGAENGGFTVTFDIPSAISKEDSPS
ncbi:cache domain-containing sensor histidine kinase [Mesobacillus foraminis]|uniref:cache domain-containing sensor histidine kinase n=1 Tax=Mesobacillus foraminis TaxID=279826 RepID=UPI00214CF0E6|nr:sensor histidine kinase [Mesobacillus foraminis]